MKKPIIFLKLVIFLICAVALVIFIMFFPQLVHELLNFNDGIESNWDYWPKFTFIGLYLTSIPFFFAFYNVLKILKNIENDMAFSTLSIKALKNIKYCALINGFLYGAALPFIFWASQADDAPGLAAIGLVITFGAVVLATVAAVLEKLVQNAVNIKEENALVV